MFFNYKKFHSIVFMAVVNANYEFVMVDIGDYGRLSDGSVFSNSHLGIAINDGTLNLPFPRKLDQYSHFGIATARFRVFRRAICANVDTNAVTKAIVALHNYLMKGIDHRSNFQYYNKELVDREADDGEIIPGTWRTDGHNNALTDISNLGSNNYSVLAKAVRNDFKTYFNSQSGSVPWQLHHIQSTEDYFHRL